MAQRPYALNRLKLEQIVVTERCCRDTAQWKKMRMFWHPDTSLTFVKITWFKGTIDEHIMGSRTMGKKLMKRPGIGTVKYIINSVDVISIYPSYCNLCVKRLYLQLVCPQFQGNVANFSCAR